MDIKVGEYIRIKNGIIGKVNQIEIAGQGTRHYNENFDETIYCIDTNDFIEHYRYKQQAIVKHSPNIIDLIEVGDYVNELYIQEIISLKDNVMKCMVDSDYECLTTITNAEIKNVVTKEQFKNVIYEV